MARIKQPAIAGIYKITSPSGKVYIGQSWNYIKRKYKYKLNKEPRQRHIFNSIEKYGYEAHIFELIHELPLDSTQEIMDNYEILYHDLYKDCGVKMLNIKEPGRGGKNSEETKKRMKENNWNAKHKGELSPSWGKKHTPQHIAASHPKGEKSAMFGRKGVLHPRFGIPQPESFKEVCRKKVVDTRNNEIFDSIEIAALAFKIDSTTLCKILKRKYKGSPNRLSFLQYYKPQ